MSVAFLLHYWRERQNEMDFSSVRTPVAFVISFPVCLKETEYVLLVRLLVEIGKVL